MNNTIGIAELATVVTTAGITFYVLGLVGLAMPIYRRFTHNMSTAWYAVSLVPRTVVAGQGVRTWLRWPIAITALMLLIVTVSWAMGAEFSKLPWLLGASISLQSFVIAAIQEMKMKLGCLTSLLNFLWLQVGIFVIGIGAISVAYNRGAPGVLGIMGIFSGSLLVGLLPAIVAEPPLPTVVIVRQEVTTEGVPAPLKGWLVAHSDGFWHLFVEEQHDLVSIPDAKVLLVQFPAGEAQYSTRLSKLFDSRSDVVGAQEGTEHPGGAELVAENITEASVA